MGIITLTTDFGIDDYRLPMLKGMIYSEVPDVNVVDISHSIAPFDIKRAAYIIKNSFEFFPDETVHIIGIDAVFGIKTKPLLVRYKRHYFICDNNGIISLIVNERIIDDIYEITIGKYDNIKFLTKDLFVKVACHLAKGGKPEIVGRKISIEEIKITKFAEPIVKGIGFVELTEKDVVRHKLVKKIIEAYGENNS